MKRKQLQTLDPTDGPQKRKMVKADTDSDSDFELPQLNAVANTMPQLVSSVGPLESSIAPAEGAALKLHKDTREDCIQEQIPSSFPFVGTPSQGRTLSVALPASIIANAQELKAYLVGQIARALVIFGVDEVIVFEDCASKVAQGSPFESSLVLNKTNDEKVQAQSVTKASPSVALKACEEVELSKSLESASRNKCSTPRSVDTKSDIAKSDTAIDTAIDTAKSDEEKDVADVLDGIESDVDEADGEADLPVNAGTLDDRKWSKSLQFFVRNLVYLDTPQYLRIPLFKKHQDLRLAGLQNPLGAPHHVKANEWIPFRIKAKSGTTDISEINCGLGWAVRVPGTYAVGSRLTVKLNPGGQQRFRRAFNQKLPRTGQYITGVVVPRHEPKKNYGLYWGYEVRAASSLRECLYESPFGEEYDLKIGTSERGEPLNLEKISKEHKHCLIVFGGLMGIEECIENEQSELAIRNAESYFDHYINTCPNQTSRTIRSEEALLISLAVLRSISHPSSVL